MPVSNPLIDDVGVIPFSTKKGSRVVINDPAITSTFCTDVIGAYYGLLLQCGWTVVSAQKATATIEYPLGFPFTSSTGTGDCGCSAGWVVIHTPIADYVYCSYVPGQTPVGVSCTMFPLDTTALGSLTNLALAISLTSPFDAVVSSILPTGYQITLTANQAGPGSNFATVAADGKFGVTDGTFFGGGYTFASTGPIPYQVRMYGVPGLTGDEQRLAMDFAFDTGVIPLGGCQYVLSTINVGQYTLFANPYSFGLIDQTPDNTPFEARSLFCAAPCIPTNEGFADAYAVVVIGPHNLRTKTAYDGNGAPITVCLDANAQTFGGVEGFPRLLALRSPNVLLNSPDGAPVQQAAYLMMAPGANQTPVVVGKLWDCAVVNDVVLDGMTIGGRTFIALGSTPGTSANTRSTLLFCVADQGQDNGGTGGSGGGTGTGGSGGGGGGTGGGGSTPLPITGVCSATGNPDNLTITWVSGDKFDASMVGNGITIPLDGTAHGWVSAGGTGDADGTLPIVASVTSPTVLTVTEGLNSAFLSCPFSC
jgi:hypothetical protein